MALHADDGPLHWLVRKLLRRGEQAVRLRAAAAAPLAAAWAACPAVASCYLEEFRSLLLDGQTDISEATASDIVPVRRLNHPCCSHARSALYCGWMTRVRLDD